MVAKGGSKSQASEVANDKKKRKSGVYKPGARPPGSRKDEARKALEKRKARCVAQVVDVHCSHLLLAKHFHGCSSIVIWTLGGTRDPMAYAGQYRSFEAVTSRFGGVSDVRDAHICANTRTSPTTGRIDRLLFGGLRASVSQSAMVECKHFWRLQGRSANLEEASAALGSPGERPQVEVGRDQSDRGPVAAGRLQGAGAARSGAGPFGPSCAGAPLALALGRRGA